MNIINGDIPLAVFGNSPVFDEPLFVGRPNVGSRDRLNVRFNQMLDRRWLTNDGPYVKEFEERVQDALKVKHCVAVCNATVGLELASRALDMKGEVIVPSFTFIATAHALQWQGVTPIFADIDPLTHNISVDAVESMITPRTTGIIGVHLWGRPCDIEALGELAKKNRINLLFDAAHAFGSTYKGRSIGNFGEAEVFSFHATKFINSFEGGMIATNNKQLADKIRLMRNFGFSGYDNVVYPGTNGKMSEISAIMGLTSLESMDEFISVNKNNYNTYKKVFNNIPGLKMVAYDESCNCNFQYIVIEVDEDVFHLNRDELLAVLQAEKVMVRRYFYPGCHRMEPYRSYFPHAGLLLGNTLKLAERVLVFPTGTAVGTEEIYKIASIIKSATANPVAVRNKLIELHGSS